jgi:hypothetical protein
MTPKLVDVFKILLAAIMRVVDLAILILLTILGVHITLNIGGDMVRLQMVLVFED